MLIIETAVKTFMLTLGVAIGLMAASICLYLPVGLLLAFLGVIR